MEQQKKLYNKTLSGLEGIPRRQKNPVLGVRSKGARPRGTTLALYYSKGIKSKGRLCGRTTPLRDDLDSIGIIRYKGRRRRKTLGGHLTYAVGKKQGLGLYQELFESDLFLMQ